MPSDDQKKPEQNEENVVKFTPPEPKKKEKGPKKGISWAMIFTYAILVTIAVVMIFGVFPSFGGSSESSWVFGSYDKEKIEFAQGNYFARQYQSLSQQVRGSGQNAAYQVWRGAFENTVFFTAMQNIAKKSGIRVVDSSVNKLILESGIYDTDGKFDAEKYNAATVESRNRVKQQYSELLPVQTIMTDNSTALIAPQEMDYIIDIGNHSRSFSYVLFDSSLFPDETAIEYAQKHPSLFTLLDISVITSASKEQAESVKSLIEQQQLSFEDAARQHSLDQFAQEGGKAGTWYLHELQHNFDIPEEVNVLFSTAEGSLSPIFIGGGGYTFYRVNKGPFEPDFNESDVIADIKTYLSLHDESALSSYLEEQAIAFAQDAVQAKNLASDAQRANLTTVSVESTPINIGLSQLLSGFMYTDQGGSLAELSQDTTAITALYTQPVGSIVGPFKTSDGYIVVGIDSQEPMESDLQAQFTMFYPFLAQQRTQQDTVNAIFSSDKLEDNFLPVFIDKIIGPTLNQ
ncbi:MAG: peptidylprolyl isomerase [Sphaerochaetaceae bacterium]|jgi:peptidyl-prolyl cis-trans isomerase D